MVYVIHSEFAMIISSNKNVVVLEPSHLCKHNRMETDLYCMCSYLIKLLMIMMSTVLDLLNLAILKFILYILHSLFRGRLTHRRHRLSHLRLN